MESFRNDIKENILMLGGTTYEAYYKRRPVNADNYDPVDGVIFKAARELHKRYLRVFALLYNCHSEEETCDRLEQRGYKSIKPNTVDRYRAYIQTRIVEIFNQSPDLMKDLNAALMKKKGDLC